MPTRCPTRFVAASAVLLLSAACFDPATSTDPENTENTGSTGNTGSTMLETGDTGESGQPQPGSSGTDSESSGGPPPVCGDGVVEGNEVCDDGINNGGYGSCTPDCTAQGPNCGDGIINGDEACDDGDEINGNGCNVNCVVSGTVLWTVTYDGPGNSVDSAGDIAIDSEDNIVIVGTVGMEDGSYAAWLRQYTPRGAAARTSFFSMPTGDTTGSHLSVFDDNSVVFGGNFDTGNPASSRDVWIQKLTSEGLGEWSVQYGSTSGAFDSITTISRDNTGSIYVLIHENQAPTPSGMRDFIRKYTAEGAELWTATMQDGNSSRSMSVTANGTWFVAGRIQHKDFPFVPFLESGSSDGANSFTSSYPEYGHSSFTTSKMSTNGDLIIGLSSIDSSDRVILADVLGTSQNEFFPHSKFPAMVVYDVLGTGNYYIVCGTRGVSSELWVSKFSLDGSIIWTSTYDMPDIAFGWDVALELATDSEQNIIVAGIIQDTEASLQDIFVRKISP